MLHVPEAANDGQPCGLVIYISSSSIKNIYKGYKDVLNEERMIWVSPCDAGNKRKPGIARLCLALDALHNLADQYNIDPNRVYISGHSGGGSMASILFFNYPDLFKGRPALCFTWPLNGIPAAS